MLGLALACVTLLPSPQETRKPSYRLPYEEGKTYPLTQGNGGSLSHTGYCEYAFDFGMPEGTKVCAAREGKVVFVREDLVRGGTGGGNQIKVDHGDGTFGLYFHLKHLGAWVEVGDGVLQGDVIGLSGATGNVTGPHLHFQVDKGSASSRVRFEDVEADGGVPQSGRSYTSRNTPGIPAETKDKLGALARAAKLAEAEGAFGLGYLAWKRFADEKLKVVYPPQEEARRRLAEIERKAEEAAAQKEPALLARDRHAFEGVPSNGIAPALEAARSDPGYAAAKAGAWYWEHYYRGLKDEIEGRLGTARGHYKNILSNKPPADLGRRAEARVQAVDARLKELLKKR